MNMSKHVKAYDVNTYVGLHEDVGVDVSVYVYVYYM